VKRVLSTAVQAARNAFKTTDFGWVMRRSAALAYYAALSMAPLLVVAIAIAGLLWDRGAVSASIVSQMSALVGPTGAALITDILRHSADEKKSLPAAIIGIVTLLIGATAVFVELQDGMNAVWEVKARKSGGIWKLIRTRLLSLAMVFSTGFLLLVSLIVSALLTAFTKLIGLGDFAVVGLVLQFLISLAVTTLMFAALFAFVPDARPGFREVLAGAVMTAILFNLGQIGIGAYLGRGSVGSAYGAAGSLVIVMVWVYYSAAIVFFGARFTRSWCRVSGCARHGAPARPEGPEKPTAGDS
jgi:membrane protein